MAAHFAAADICSALEYLPVQRHVNSSLSRSTGSGVSQQNNREADDELSNRCPDPWRGVCFAGGELGG
jgi:hypothetical protein